MAYVVIALCFGLAGGIVGKLKGSSFWHLVPDLGRACRSSASRPRCSTAGTATSCGASAPAAGSVVKLHDALCTRCGTELDFPEVAIASEADVADRRPRSARRGANSRQ